MKDKISNALKEPGHASNLDQLASMAAKVGYALAVIKLIVGIMSANGASVTISRYLDVERSFNGLVFATALVSSLIIVALTYFISSVLSALAAIAADASAAKELALLSLGSDGKSTNLAETVAPVTNLAETITPVKSEPREEGRPEPQGEGKEPAPLPAESGTARLIPQDEDKGKCSACGQVQRLNRNVCLACNLKFKK